MKTENPPAMKPAARREARRYALQAMYQWHIANAAVIDIETEFLRYHINKEVDLAYFKELINGIPQQLTTIDAAMQPFLLRPLIDVDPIELGILRIAIYELLKRLDVPYRVVINEALELAKRFGSVESFKFINGLLDKIAKKLRAVEIQG